MQLIRLSILTKTPCYAVTTIPLLTAAMELQKK